MTKHKPRWVAVATGLAPNPRISPAYNAPSVLVTLLIDDQGRLWQRVGSDAPELLGGPPSDSDATR